MFAIVDLNLDFIQSQKSHLKKHFNYYSKLILLLPKNHSNYFTYFLQNQMQNRINQ